MAASQTRVARNLTRGTVLASAVVVADTMLARMRGLLGRQSLSPGEGLYLTPCQSIHMIGMKFPIDAIFLDGQLTVVGLIERIGPGQISALYVRAASCLELPQGTIAESGTSLGDLVELAEEAGDQAKPKN